MILALLKESDLILSDDIIEAIINKVWFAQVIVKWPDLSQELMIKHIFPLYLHRHLRMQISKEMEKLIRKSGRNLWLATHPCWRTWRFHIWSNSLHPASMFFFLPEKKKIIIIIIMYEENSQRETLHFSIIQLLKSLIHCFDTIYMWNIPAYFIYVFYPALYLLALMLLRHQKWKPQELR